MKHIAWIIGVLILITAYTVIEADRRGLFDHVSEEERRELQALSPAGKHFGEMCIQDGYSEGMLNATVRLFGKEQALLGMIESLKLGNANARACAAWCLGQMGDLKAIGPLEITSRDTVEFVRTSAAEALQRLRSRAPQPEKTGTPKRGQESTGSNRGT